MKPSSRIIVAVAGSALLILLLNTCGIEQIIPQLQKPSNGGEYGGGFVFDKTIYNSEAEFSGFDLYYKMYLADADVTADTDDIVEFADLGANGFRRIHASDDIKSNIQRPLIRIQLNDRTPLAVPPDNDAFTLTVDFSGTPDLEEPFPKIVDDGNTDLIDAGDTPLADPPPILIEITDIRRDVLDSVDDSYKRFSDFSDGDADIDTDIWEEIDLGFEVKIVLYAVSYGYDIFNFRSLYSEPEKLGELVRTFP